MENEENKEQNITLEKPKNTNQNQVAGAILIAGLFIAGAIMLKGSTPPTNAVEKDEIKIDLSPITKEDHIKGAENAKIIIVEYSDLECPFCKVFHNTMNTIVSENKDVAWVYRHFPIASLHEKAMKEAIATECAWEAGGNDAFWKYTDRVFEVTTSNDGLDSSELPKIAEFIGIDLIRFNDCLNTNRYQGKVEKDMETGIRAGVRGTPKGFIIKNGKVIDTIDGAQPINSVRSKIQDALK